MFLLAGSGDELSCSQKHLRKATGSQSIFTRVWRFATLPRMLKKLLPLLLAPLLLAGCKATLTNLTPQTRLRNPDNLYQVEVAFVSSQQSLRRDSIKPQVVVGDHFYPMRPTPLMTNRWETLIPVSPTAASVEYRYKFDFNYNSIGAPRSDSALSSPYTLRIVDK
jgi:hypothetical protein